MRLVDVPQYGLAKWVTAQGSEKKSYTTQRVRILFRKSKYGLGVRRPHWSVTERIGERLREELFFKFLPEDSY